MIVTCPAGGRSLEVKMLVVGSLVLVVSGLGLEHGGRLAGRRRRHYSGGVGAGVRGDGDERLEAAVLRL